MVKSVASKKKSKFHLSAILRNIIGVFKTDEMKI